MYPDATFTLRLNFGTVQGWNEKPARRCAPFTRLERAVRARHRQRAVPHAGELDVRSDAQLDLKTPFNLSTNNDIVGGNSGSPLINAQGRDRRACMFDGNIHSISGSYWFDTAKNRSVAVHPAIIAGADPGV